MKILTANHKVSLLAMSLMVLLTGCDRLPEYLTQQVNGMPDRIKTQQAFIQSKETELNGFQSDPDWQFFKPYMEKENWSINFQHAKQSITEGESVYKTQIMPIVEKNESQNSKKLSHLIDGFNAHLINAKKSAQTPGRRKAFLIKARNETEQIYIKAQTLAVDANKDMKAIYNYAEKTTVSYPNKATDITKRLQVMKGYDAQIQKMVAILTQEYNRRESGQTDYAIFADTAHGITGLSIKVKKEETKLTSKLHELYQSYTKVLTDQRIDYYVVIGRATWCEGEYCSYDGNSMKYSPVKVDEATYEYFGSLNSLVAEYQNSFFGGEKFTLKVPQKYWEALRLSYKKSWPSGDDYGEYWVEDVKAKGFHKYSEITNGEQNNTNWMPVSEDFYWKNQENLGMAIINKPYGVYKDETLKQSEPVGMSMIATPQMNKGVASGSNEYGEWRQNRSGHSFWHYYGQYSLINSLLGNNRGYSYDEWNGYQSRNRSQGYYGRNQEYGTYGHSTYQNKRYQSSHYAKRNASEVSKVKAGAARNSKSSKPSIRSAGSTSRSRGPSGGGK